MPNPYLPLWEYIPDGEPRVFGDRVYIYGSQDCAGSHKFCDTKLKVWSASVDDLNNWKCHGDIFHTYEDEDHPSDTDWTTQNNELFAPDVVEKDGKYYLYAYIKETKGCVAVADRPEGPFKLLSQYKYQKPEDRKEDYCDNGIFIDPGVLVDDDGRVYIYCGFLKSFAAELNADNMYEVIDSTYVDDIIPKEEPFKFFEACSPRKIGDTYYLIYSNTVCSQLVYATSKSPLGPFKYQGIIIDSGADYPGGNNHGSIMKIKDQWYIFYHRMTNGSIFSRRGCVEPITILPDGTIPQVEPTSLGFEKSLSPYHPVPADIACILKNDCFITEKDTFTRVVTNIKNGAVIGYKYFDFGEDFSSKTMKFAAKIQSMGSYAKVKIMLDDDVNGEEIGYFEVTNDGNSIVRTRVKSVTGRHALYFVAEDCCSGEFAYMFKDRQLFELQEFVFMK
ncbi:MAG: family 43 glycosylhydrolase [Clostridiales bacterium]|nr:family 43 glycosylhydrolase [Clostridiales bacterium]